MKSNKF
jgi:hypothetical protein